MINLTRSAAWLGAAAALGYLAVWTIPSSAKPGQADLAAFAALPVLDGGRVKPIDTFARTTLTTINSRQNFVRKQEEYGEKSYPPVEWLLEVWGGGPGGAAVDYPVFRITDLQVVDYFNLPQRPGFWRYSASELAPKFAQFQRDVERLQIKQRQDANQLTPFDNNLLEVGHNANLYLRLANRQDPATVPPQADDQGWRSVAEFEQPLVEELEARAAMAALQEVKPGANFADLKNLTPDEAARVRNRMEEMVRAALNQFLDQHLAEASPAAEAFVNVCRLYRAGKFDDFNRAVAAYRSEYFSRVPADDLNRVHYEALLNRAAPVFHSMILYVTAFVLVCLSWVAAGLNARETATTLRRGALGMVTATVVVHLALLIIRMFLMNRWFVFVTNLYSSAVFIGWACAGLGLLVELLFGRGLGTAVAAVTGGSSLIVAYFLGSDGDTLGSLQAVLDTNFWLATHVTTVALGYSATFFAGFFGLTYLLTGLTTPYLTGEVRKSLAQVTYGVICFATLLSFTGTVLGGLWADQSWGRFWGWDPKENGALLIVIWNALVLHARWGGLIKQRGVAVLAVFGCVVTTWSWFGTNQLGVGLHSYGFTTGRTIAIICTSAGFTLLGCLGLIPIRYWRSTRAPLVQSTNAKGVEVKKLDSSAAILTDGATRAGTRWKVICAVVGVILGGIIVGNKNLSDYLDLAPAMRTAYVVFIPVGGGYLGAIIGNLIDRKKNRG